jgi:small basic protein
MLFKEDPLPPPQRPERPIGIAVLTLWDGIIFGIIPILSTVFGLLRSRSQEAFPVTIYISTVLSVLIITVAIGTFTGSDRSRAALIYLVTLYQSIEAFNSVILIASGTLPSADTLFAAVRIFSALFWIALHIWYFLRPKTLEFYRRPVQSAHSH